MRQLRILDAIANGASVKLSTLDSIVLDGDKAADRDEDGEDATGNHAQLEDRFLPTKHNPVYDLAYGQMLMVSRSFGSAISESVWVRQVMLYMLTHPVVQSTSCAHTNALRNSHSSICLSASRISCVPCPDRPTIVIIRLRKVSPF